MNDPKDKGIWSSPSWTVACPFPKDDYALPKEVTPVKKKKKPAKKY